MAFLKFIDKKGADSFVSGTMQFGQVKKYLDIEKNKGIGRYDDFRLCQLNQTPQHALCLYHLDDKHSTDRIEDMLEFGDYIVKIEDEIEFDRRIKIGAADNKYMLYDRDIVYYRDKSIEDEMMVMELVAEGFEYMSFVKREEIFLYQNEYRYLITNESANNKNIRFSIGNLEDIATVMSKSEFFIFLKEIKSGCGKMS